MKILIVDDNKDSVNPTIITAKAIGHKVRFIESAEKALAAALNGAFFDIVLLDYSMPNEGSKIIRNGGDLARYLLNVRSLEKTVIAFFTAADRDLLDLSGAENLPFFDKVETSPKKMLLELVKKRIDNG